jgi:hypothetical protein
MSAQGKVISMTKLPPGFIRKGFPRTWYHPRWRLLTWYPRGVLNEAFADQVIEFIEMEERIQEAPFDRYADLSGLTHIRIGIDHIIHTARQRRTVKQTGQDGAVRGQSDEFRRRALVRVADARRNDRSPRFQGTRRGGAMARGAAEDP